jgi:hypothetical protein
VEEHNSAFAWQDEGRWCGEDCDRESFLFPFFSAGAGQLYGSLYCAKPAPPQQCMVVLPNWGHGGRFSLEWCHQLAYGAARLGTSAMVVHWPGTEDSDECPSEVTLELLVEVALRCRGLLGERFGEIRCSIAGFGVGGTVAALAQARGGFHKAALVQPVLGPEGYFKAVEARARLSLASGAPHRGWGFGERVPPGLKSASPTSVQESLGAPRCIVAVIHYSSPGSSPLPAGVREIAVRRGWPRPAGWDNVFLRRETLRFLCGRAPRSVM